MKWVILILFLVALGLAAVIFLYINRSDNNDTASSESTSQVTGSTQASSSEEGAETGEPSSVTFEKGKVYTGSDDQYGYSITTYQDSENIVVSHGPLGQDGSAAPMSDAASLVPQTVDTQPIQINENGEIKEVQVNTELVLSNTPNAASLGFFVPFNSSNTKIFAYNTPSGNIALAFTSQGTIDQYQVVEFTLSHDSE
ncbi:hypothetical protein NRIC_25080 [Enterococcus florum]|uniref:Uncharacterized protein n=2 Tax=Enterococcus florum TaxID=2480627 RepID=A0A4P5P979_9ENTE|nr:hypothetical protein NRIC_25080 [Enterococcus florum]